ncbi:hypothetical protein ACRAWG_31380 [Methylobacterium sp. P31]
MRTLALLAVLALAPVPALAQNLSIPISDVGRRIADASTRIGEHLDWGAGTCGEPKQQPGTCVWDLGPRLSLTAHSYDAIYEAKGEGLSSNATIIITRWSHVDLQDSATRDAFDQACRGLVAALRPDWPAAKVVSFTSALIGSADKDRGANANGIGFAFYALPGSVTCEAQLAND